MIVVSVIRRLLRARLAPHLLTPDIWIIMGAQAGPSSKIWTHRPEQPAARRRCRDGHNVLAGRNRVDSAARRGRGTCQRATSTPRDLALGNGLPLGMCGRLRHVGNDRPSARELLHDASTTMFWVASTAWLATTICMTSSPLRSTSGSGAWNGAAWGRSERACHSRFR